MPSPLMTKDVIPQSNQDLLNQHHECLLRDNKRSIEGSMNAIQNHCFRSYFPLMCNLFTINEPKAHGL